MHFGMPPALVCEGWEAGVGAAGRRGAGSCTAVRAFGSGRFSQVPLEFRKVPLLQLI
jgi:hypothetical protein